MGDDMNMLLSPFSLTSAGADDMDLGGTLPALQNAVVAEEDEEDREHTWWAALPSTLANRACPSGGGPFFVLTPGAAESRY